MSAEKKPSAYIVWEKSIGHKLTVERRDNSVTISETIACMYAASHQSLSTSVDDARELIRMLEAAVGEAA